MIKFLNGSELAGFIKERQAHQVRGLRQHDKVFPRLAIIQTADNPVIDTYVRLKRVYGADILIDVDVYKIAQPDVSAKIVELNDDATVHGIIVQLPLIDPGETDTIVNQVAPEKDVDGLGRNAQYDSATAVAINWMLTGYNIELRGKKIAVVGQGRLVGAPLTRMWRNSGYDISALDESTPDIRAELLTAEVIVSATGVPGLVTTDMIQPSTAVVDAGTASEGGKIVGDVAEDVYDRNDIIITPTRGGVGPLTIAALFDNVIRAARASVKTG
ncbi:bifunctional protein FolD [Alphaproteobacteria bacterium]|nr:bifunctional protein FolD [Alphaproteobacteria bacterium]